MRVQHLVNIAICATAVASVPVSASAQQIAKIGPGDEILVVIPEGVDVAEKKAVVDADGYIALGVYGRVKVAGLSEKDAEAATREALTEYLASTDGVAFRVQSKARRVLVTGHVKKPGAVSLGPGESAWDAIARAGGPRQGARLADVAILSGGTQRREVDIRGYLAGKSSTPPVVAAGETIFVPAGAGVSADATAATALLGNEEVAGKIFVLGAVRKPGMYAVAEGMDATRALAAAEGPAPDAALAHARLLSPDGARQVDLAAALSGQKTAQLPRGDFGLILFVPARPKAGEESMVPSVHVTGAIESPGPYEIARPTPLPMIIARAGGAAQGSNASRVSVITSGSGFTIASTYDVKRYMNEGGVVAMAKVRPGDIIHVPRREDEAVREVAKFVSDIAVIAATFTLLLAF